MTIPDLLVSIPRRGLGGLARAGRMVLMAVAGAFGGPPPKPFRHVDESAEIAEERKP